MLMGAEPGRLCGVCLVLFTASGRGENRYFAGDDKMPSGIHNTISKKQR